MNNRRRNFRPRSTKNNFRRRSISVGTNNANNFNNGNKGFSRNGPTNNIHSVEKVMLKFQQLAKDVSSGDLILVENYLQHADHYLRRFRELSERNKEVTINKPNVSNNCNEDQKRDQNLENVTDIKLS